jgi:hypothetical protein
MKKKQKLNQKSFVFFSKAWFSLPKHFPFVSSTLHKKTSLGQETFSGIFNQLLIDFSSINTLRKNKS